jgi:hypothetical protein
MQFILVESWPCLVCLHGLSFSFVFDDNTLFGQLFLLVLSPLFLFSILLGLSRLLDEGYRCRCILRNPSGAITSVGTVCLNTRRGIVPWSCALVGEASLTAAGAFRGLVSVPLGASWDGVWVAFGSGGDSLSRAIPMAPPVRRYWSCGISSALHFRA